MSIFLITIIDLIDPTITINEENHVYKYICI